MGERKHTPWRVIEPAHWTNPNMGLWEVETADGINVCSHLTRDDAFRVAALPDLLEALKGLLANIGNPQGINPDTVVEEYEAARAAIQRAEGQ